MELAPRSCRRWYFDERSATVAAAEIVARVEEKLDAEDRGSVDRDGDESFREVAGSFIEHRTHVKGSRPSTIADYRSMLAEPGVPLKRRFVVCDDGKPLVGSDGDKVRVVTEGSIRRRIGNQSAAEITTRDFERILQDLSDAGRGPTTVNKYRALLSSIYSYACRSSTFDLDRNPVADADRRRQPPPPDLECYSLEEVEAVARALAAGLHRGRQPMVVTTEAIEHRKYEDQQAAELVRVAAYTGLRRGELVSLRWSDVDLKTRRLHVRRTLSRGVEVDAPK